MSKTVSTTVMSLALLAAITGVHAEAAHSGVGNNRVGNTVGNQGMMGQGLIAPNSNIQPDVMVTSRISTHNTFDTAAGTGANVTDYTKIEPAAGPADADVSVDSHTGYEQ